MTIATHRTSLFERARSIANAVLYEGYVLYPYRASSTKNQWRWQFGVLAPRVWSEATGCEGWAMQTECLLEASSDFTVEACVRGFRLRRRTNAAWEEGAELEFEASCDVLTSDGTHVVRDFDLIAETDPSKGTFEPIAIRVEIAVDPIPSAKEPLFRVRLRVENRTPWEDVGAPRENALLSSLASVHALIGARRASFLSMTDAPTWAKQAAGACVNERAWPVLVGSEGQRDVVLASPIILYDYPQVAPESPGDLCDGLEIDEILTLRTLTLTDDEKRQARATDERAAAIVDRADALTPEQLGRLHGTFRDAPPRVTTKVSLERGTKVRLMPKRRADAQDMFLVGRIAVIEDVLTDVDGNGHVAVTLVDDPASDLHQWYGRYLYFAPDELEAVE